MKLYLTLTHSNMHGISWFKAQINQHIKIYNNIIIILRNERFDSMTSWRCRTGIGWIQALGCSTVLLQCLWSWLDESLRFNYARILQNLDLPLLLQSFKHEQTGTDSLDSSLKLAQRCFQMMNQVMDCDLVLRNFQKSWEKKFKKISRSENCDCC